jgi:hypothetical protein
MGDWASLIARYLLGVILTGGIAAWEGFRIAAARDTVPGGWGAGLAWGAGGGLALTALFISVIKVSRRYPRRGTPALVALGAVALVAVLTFIVALAGSTPPKGYHPRPYVVTTSFEVAGMAYVGVCTAGFALALAIAGVVAMMRD